MRKGSGLLTVISLVAFVCLILAACVGGCINKHIVGNKQYFDFKQHFSHAYISYPDGKTEVVEVDSWKDWKESDAIQVVDKAGKVYYTHLNRVILTNK